MRKTAVRKFKRLAFSLDEGPVYTGWTDGELWNGWAVPYFEKDEALRVARDWNGGGNVAAFESQRGEFGAVVMSFEGGEPDVYDGFRILTPEGEKVVYSVGGMASCWTERKLADADEQRIAREFSLTLRANLSRDEMAEVLRRNEKYRRDGQNDVCASHEFLDANVLMFDAFKEVMGREPDLDSQVDISLWSRAWDLAVTRRFWTAKGRA